MKNLELDKLDKISGGLGPQSFVGWNPGAFTTVVGNAAKVAPMVRPALTAFQVGYGIGNAINKYTPVQSWISSGLDKIHK